MFRVSRKFSHCRWVLSQATHLALASHSARFRLENLYFIEPKLDGCKGLRRRLIIAAIRRLWFLFDLTAARGELIVALDARIDLETLIAVDG